MNTSMITQLEGVFNGNIVLIPLVGYSGGIKTTRELKHRLSGSGLQKITEV